MRAILDSVDTLIFDLGGVIVNLSYEETYKAFAHLSGKSVDEVRILANNLDEFKQYEMGKIDDAAFRGFIRNRIGISARDEEIDQAWNAMLLDIPSQRLKVLQKLRNTYRTFLLSNTNAIHLRAFSQTVKQVSNQDSLSFCFEKLYYSHEIGLRKPDVNIYEHVLTENTLTPSKTLFFDDLLPNLEGAKSAGIQTYHVANADELFRELDRHK
jgi:glucose-1-phosphatase